MRSPSLTLKSPLDVEELVLRAVDVRGGGAAPQHGLAKRPERYRSYAAVTTSSVMSASLPLGPENRGAPSGGT